MWQSHFIEISIMVLLLNYVSIPLITWHLLHLEDTQVSTPLLSSITSYLLYSYVPCSLQLSSPHGVVSFSSFEDDVVWRAGADVK